jgi:hypothetical protein
VNDSLRSEVSEPIVDISKYFRNLLRIQGSSFLDFSFKIALVTVLGNDVAVSIAGKDFEAAKDVGVVKFFEDRDLLEKQLF